MSPRLCILGCRNFEREVAASIAAEGWDDVVAAAFPPGCGMPPVTWEDLRRLLPADCGEVVVLGRACLRGLGEPPAGFPPTRIVPLAECFHLVADRHLVDEFISNGAYLITPAWLADWRENLRKMGFAPEQGGEFFREFAREMLLLDTGIDPETETRLAELREALKLPARRIPVGLDHARQVLVRLVLEWRLAQERQACQELGRRHASELADQLAAMDMLTRLARTQHEEEVVAAIEDLFRMLFCPAVLHYLRVENNVPLPDERIPAEMRGALTALRDDYAWLPDGKGFMLRIGRGDAPLGLVAVVQLAFPEYRERYINTALTISGVCALAIDNVRNRKKLLQAEKMASLAILVAGVAHEINTPLGVSLAAASTLQDRSRQLAERFAAHSMTQSDLAQYLDTARLSTALMLGNLERIGQLIDAFRQVAVDGRSPERRPLRLRDCLDEVIRSLGDRLPADRVSVSIQCDPALEIRSHPGDWASIFANLIGNSLKHGFKGRERGAIDIQVVGDVKTLSVDYHDDGVGLGPEALARIFDPFFTTDFQLGMGLGMHLVYNLITHRMGGSIRCASETGQGVRFHIEVPLEGES